MAEEKFVDPELLLKYYLDDKLSTRQIGEIFNITHGVIKTKLKKVVLKRLTNKAKHDII